MADRSFAVVTGASTGIGYELAGCCARNGFDLVVVVDEPAIHDAAEQLRQCHDMHGAAAAHGSGRSDQN